MTGRDHLLLSATTIVIIVALLATWQIAADQSESLGTCGAESGSTCGGHTPRVTISTMYEEERPQSMKGELSLRNKLYMKIGESLSEAEVESLRQSMITDNHIARGRVENAKPHEMFNMLEADGKIGRGDLGLLKDLLKALRKGKLAADVEDVEKEEGRSMDDPIKLTSTRVVDSRRQVSISPEAEKILSSLPPRYVDVVSVVGPMRKGKSHLANLLCKKKSGFPLGDEMKTKTKGFWFWIGPHPVQTDSYLMVVDTEGLGDYSDEEQKDKDIKYLVLATLLSNQLVFNLQGNPDSGFVSNLRLMGDLAECIRVQKDGSDEGNNLGEHFPELWVAVQNVHLNTPEKNGRRLTPDEFLEVLLENKDGHTKAIRSHNDMTSTVKAFFPKRHLRLIPSPSIKKDVLSYLDKVEDSALQTDYKDAVDKFTREIWNSGQIKKVNGDGIKTTGLLHIMQYYVDAINDPNVMPSVLGAYEAMAEGECRRASEEHLKTFQKTVEETVKPLMPTDEEICNTTIKAAMNYAVTKLSADVGKWDKDGTWKKLLQEKLETEHLALLGLNSDKSKDLCGEILKEVDQPIQQKVGSGAYNRIGGFNTYVEDMNGVYTAYREKASGKGPAIEKVLETFNATEMTRRNAIKDADYKLVQEDLRVKERDILVAQAQTQAAEAEAARQAAIAAAASSRRRRRRRGWF